MKTVFSLLVLLVMLSSGVIQAQSTEGTNNQGTWSIDKLNDLKQDLEDKNADVAAKASDEADKERK
jgi:hypothetical protein